jgi:P4 family phage/plasmid primase-like protien
MAEDFGAPPEAEAIKPAWTTEQVKPRSVGTHYDALPVDPLSPMFSDDYLALEFTKRHGAELRYVHQWGKWLKWNGTRWVFESTLAAFDMARVIAREYAAMCNGGEDDDGPSPTKIASAATVSAIERMARSDRTHAATADIWDTDPWLLNTPGGIVDLKTGITGDPDPDKFMTKITSVGPGGECPRWLKFLDEVTAGDKDYQAFLKRGAGYTLTGLVNEHVLFFLYGTGRNGKGVLLNTLFWLLGDYAVVAPMETFVETHGQRHPTDLAGFRGKRLVMAQEVDDGLRWAESKIKTLTGGDAITARFMRQDFFDYWPQFKLWIGGNHKPGLRGVDVAIRERFHMLPFMVSFAAKPDKTLSETLRGEAPGILQWAIDGCLEWQRDGLKPPSIVRSATDDYINDQDKIGRWIEERCELGLNNWQSSADLWSSFSSWTERNNERLGTQRAFSDALGNRVGITGGEGAKVNRVRGFCGIALAVPPRQAAPVAQPDAGAYEPDYDPADYRQ